MEVKKSYRDILCVGLEPQINIQEDETNYQEDETNYQIDESKYRIIDVRKQKFRSVSHLDKNCTNMDAIPYNKKEKPLLIKQIEQYAKPLTFDLMTIGNYYVVREKPYSDWADDDNFVMQCIGKEIDTYGNKWINYKMTSDPDEYLGCRYIVTKSNKFTNKKFRRLPHDFWTNYLKYKNQIKKEYFVDHVELTGIY